MTIASKHRRDVVSKHRYLVDESKLFKVDDGSVSPLDSRAEETVAEQILAASEGAAGVIFADFGYGLITAGLLDRILPTLRSRVPVLTADVSGKRSNLLQFKGVDLLCPTEREMRETLQDFSSGLGAVVSKLLTTTNAKQALITLGKQGLVSFDWPGGNARESDGRLRSEYVPALSGRTVDPLGCGDALLATASLALAAGGSLASGGAARLHRGGDRGAASGQSPDQRRRDDRRNPPTRTGTRRSSVGVISHHGGAIAPRLARGTRGDCPAVGKRKLMFDLSIVLPTCNRADCWPRRSSPSHRPPRAIMS